MAPPRPPAGARRNAAAPDAATAAPKRRRALPWVLAGVVLAIALAGLLAWLRHTGPARLAPEAGRPRLLSTAELLAGHSNDWRVARLQDNPALLVVEFPTLAAQGATMNRAAALLEKADAPRDRVLSDAEVSTLIMRAGDNPQTFYQGHDYEASGLVNFYTLAQRQGQALNAQEARLKRLLLDAGLLTLGEDGLKAPQTQALITFTAIQRDDPSTPQDETVDERRRESVLRHELSHGRFFTRPAYREHCRRFWREVLTEPQRELFRRYLATLGYDRRNEDLMLNEAQAFLMHTSDTRAFDPVAMGLEPTEVAALRERFWQLLPAETPASAPAPR